jgi:hypothetical protein
MKARKYIPPVVLVDFVLRDVGLKVANAKQMLKTNAEPELKPCVRFSGLKSSYHDHCELLPSNMRSRKVRKDLRLFFRALTWQHLYLVYICWFSLTVKYVFCLLVNGRESLLGSSGRKAKKYISLCYVCFPLMQYDLKSPARGRSF